ncbi:MAG TPA: ABC transporter substrate-binding protein, partial [Vicinamibacterales bacterium]
MKRFRSASLALASASALAAIASAARPHYGGTLRVETAGVIHSIDPSASADASDAWTKSRLLPLVFETLTTIDADTGLQPQLASSWENVDTGTRWRLRIRRGVVLHDGSTLEGWQVAASLRAANPAWTVDADGDTVIVTPDRPSADLPWELARPRQAIAVRKSAAELVGSGPFRIDRFDGRRAILKAHDRYWGARPFLDAIQIEMSRALTDQLASVERGAADFVSARPTDVHRLEQRELRVVASRPLELVALVFEPHRVTTADGVVRRAVADAVDRRSLSAVLLQQYAAPATALVPVWLSGYSVPALPPSPGRTAIAALTPAQRTVTIRVDAADA